MIVFELLKKSVVFSVDANNGNKGNFELYSLAARKEVVELFGISISDHHRCYVLTAGVDEQTCLCGSLHLMLSISN